MFTALILICAGGIKESETCFYQAHQEFTASREECMTVISDSLHNNPGLFEFYDEQLDIQWKVTDIRCVNWKEIKV
jgi:hypothetical protein